jgi:hypothetical protein
MDGQDAMHKQARAVSALSIAAIALLLTASIIAIVLDDGGAPYSFISARGEAVDLYGGAGPYRYDNTYKAVMFRGFDWVNLVVVLPLFVLGLFLYRRGQLRGQFLLAALFAYLGYIYLIGVMGNAFNGMFLGWTALFSFGLIGLCLILADINLAALPHKLADHFPRKSVAIYVVIVGVILLAQYLAEIVTAYATSKPPASLDHYTTLELAALELGIMIPLHIIGGLSLWRRKAWGYVLSAILTFTALMVFIALSVSLLLLYFLYGLANLPDMAVTMMIALVAAGFSLIVFRQIKG